MVDPTKVENKSFSQEAVTAHKQQQVVRDPLGTPVPVPEGMTIQQVLEQIQKTYQDDPKLMGQVLQRQQIKDLGESSNPIDPNGRRAFLARQIDGPVIPGDIDDFAVRFDLARSDMVTEKLAKLRSYFPDSEFHLAKDVDESPVILYRHPGQAEYREAEAPEFSAGDMAALAGGTLDSATTAEVVAFLKTRGVGNIGKTLFKAFFAGAGGEGIDVGIESARGFEHSSGGAITERIVGTGIAGAVGAGIFDPAGRVINILRGKRGITVPAPRANEAIEIAEDLGLPDLLPGQTHILFRSMQQQASGTDQGMAEFIRDQFHNTVSRLADIRDSLGDFRDLKDDILEKFIDKEEKKILSSFGTIPEMSFNNMGRKIRKGLMDFQEALSEREGRAYLKAFNMSKGVRFNLQPAQQLAASIRGRIVGDIPLKDLGKTVRLDLTPINDNQFRQALSELVSLQPDVRLTAGNASPLEQLVRLRSTFINLARDERLTGTERVASGKISEVLTDIMMTPRGLTGSKGNLKPAVAQAWRRAAGLSISRVRWEDRTYGRLLSSSLSPSQIGKKLNLVNIDVVKGVHRAFMASGNKSGWAAVQAGFKSNLLTKPGSIANRLKGADKETLDLLVPKADQKELINISNQWQRMQKGPIVKMLNSATDLGDRAIQLVNTGSRADIRELLIEAGGKNSPTGKALQAGIIESLLRASTKEVEGKVIINKEVFTAGVKKFRERGILDEVFSGTTQEALVDKLDLYIQFLPKSMGVGEGLQAAEAASAVGNVLVPTPGGITKALSGGRTILKNKIWAWMFISDIGKSLLRGSGKPNDAEGFPAKLGQLGAVLTVIFDSMEDVAESGSFETSGEDIVPNLF